MDKPIPVPPASITAPVITGPSKKSRLPLILLIILFLILVSVAGYFGYKYWQLKRVPAGSNPTAPSPLVSPALSEVEPAKADDPTANWLTYTNSVHHVSFKYPDTWQLDKTNDSEIINAALTLTKGSANIKMNFHMDGIGGQGQTYQGKAFILDGHNLYQYEAENTYTNSQIVGITDSLTDTIGVFKLDNITYSIALSYPIGSAQAADLTNEFNQILSTFKFSDWLTYSTTGKYSLSFKYEPGGTLTEGNNPEAKLNIVHVVYSGKQLDWFVQPNDENLSLKEFIEQNSIYNGSIEENKTIGQFTGTYIVFPQAERGKYDFTGPSINFYFQNNQHGPLVHWVRLMYTKENLTESDYQYFDDIIKSAVLN